MLVRMVPGVRVAKRVVTGVNADGRSYIVSCEELVSEQPLGVVWTLDPGDPQLREWIADISPDRLLDVHRLLDVDSKPGGALLVRFVADPRSTEQPYWHATKTIDFCVVLEGLLTLLLDEGSVEVEKGDIVIQQATHHAWRAEGDQEAVMVSVGISLP